MANPFMQLMGIKHTKRGRNQDNKRRSKEPWERGKGAKKKGNPRYKPVMRNGRKVYIVRKTKKK